MHIMNIIELAKKLNLSITTVSRALGGYSDVSEVTRKRVMEFAKKHLDKNIQVVSILKKKSSNEFIIPLQGKYLSDVKSLNKNNIYQNQKVGSSKAIGQIPDNNKRKN